MSGPVVRGMVGLASGLILGAWLAACDIPLYWGPAWCLAALALAGSLAAATRSSSRRPNIAAAISIAIGGVLIAWAGGSRPAPVPDIGNGTARIEGEIEEVVYGVDARAIVRVGSASW